MADPASLPDTLARMTAFVAAQESMIDALSAWSVGSAEGGPAGDGGYPLQVRGGPSVTLPCPARIRRDANTPRLIALTIEGVYRPTLDQLNAIVRVTSTNRSALLLPQHAPLGTSLIAVQWGAGPLNVAGFDGSHDVRPSGTNGTNVRGGKVTAIAMDVDAQGDTIWLIEGDVP